MSMTDTIRLQVTVLRTPERDWTIGLPAATKRRLITTTALTTTATALWLGAAGLLPFAELDARVATVGLLPYAVGWVTLLAAEVRADRDLRRAKPKDYGSSLSEAERAMGAR